MSRQKVFWSTYLEEGQIEALRGLSQRTRVPMAVHVRAALDTYLKLFAPVSAGGAADALTCCPWHRSGGLAEVPCRATVSDDGGWNDGAAAQYVAHAKREGGRS